jgi:hypothetical protein
MCWHSHFNAITLWSLMRRRLLSTTGLLAFALACPAVAYAQAEELPPPAADPVPAPTASRAAGSPIAAPATPAVPAILPSTPVDAGVRDHAWLIIPYFGLNLPVATAARSYSAGFRLGVIAGWSLTPKFSLNGEFTLDLMDGDADASMLKPHEHYLDFVLSPLFHFQSGKIVVGPRLGWFTNNRSFSDSDSLPMREWKATEGARSAYTGPLLEEHSGQGLLFGFNVGGFVPLGKVTIGMVASSSFRHFTTVRCGLTGCVGDYYSFATIMSLSLAALF